MSWTCESNSVNVWWLPLFGHPFTTTLHQTTTKRNHRCYASCAVVPETFKEDINMCWSGEGVSHWQMTPNVAKKLRDLVGWSFDANGLLV